MGFVRQSTDMKSNWAEENLETIRTLMERSALYRRALAPIAIFAGVIGTLAAAIGIVFRLNSPRIFGAFWLGAALLAIAGAFLIVRRQALRAKEPFWSPPTRRVAQTLLPPLTSGLVLGMVFSCAGLVTVLPFLWALFYGCALYSAGFFVPRGLKWFGWIYILLASVFLCFLALLGRNPGFIEHWLMGFFFGILHLAYGAYLYLTERENAA